MSTLVFIFLPKYAQRSKDEEQSNHGVASSLSQLRPNQNANHGSGHDDKTLCKNSGRRFRSEKSISHQYWSVFLMQKPVWRKRCMVVRCWVQNANQHISTVRVFFCLIIIYAFTVLLTIPFYSVHVHRC